MDTFSEVIEAFGVDAMASVLKLEESHVRVMKVRRSIPPEYWGALIEAAPNQPNKIDLSWQMLSAMRDKRFGRCEAFDNEAPPERAKAS